MANLYTVLPFTWGGGVQVPALHDLQRNVHKYAWMNRPDLYFKPDKMRIVISNYQKWVKFFKEIDNPKAWQYLQKQQSGVFQTGYPGYQPCIFATASFAHNLVSILSTFWSGGVQWGQVRCMSVRDDPPPASQRDWLFQFGLMHKYTVEGIVKDVTNATLYQAPKANGEVYNPVLSDGTALYVEMSKLVPLV